MRTATKVEHDTASVYTCGVGLLASTLRGILWWWHNGFADTTSVAEAAQPAVPDKPPPPPFAILPMPESPEVEALFRAIRRPPFAEIERRSGYRTALEHHELARKRLYESFAGDGAWQRHTEGYSALDDPDDRIVGPGGGHSIQYRAVAGRGEWAMPVDQVRAIDESRYLHFKSPLKSACDGLTARYMGNTPEIRCEDPDVQKVVDDFLADSYNALMSDTEELATRLRVDGQLLLLTTVGEDGRVRVRRWDPRNIVAARFEDSNPNAPEHLRILGAMAPKTKERKAGDERTGEAFADERGNNESVWRVIRQRDLPDQVPDDEEGKTHFASTRADVTPAEGPPLLDGDAFWVRINTVNGDFGMPDGVSVFHILDQYDELRAQAVRSARIKGTYALKIKLEGFTKDQLDAFKQQYTLPAPAGAAIYFCNEKGDIEPLTFALGSADFEEHMLALKKLILAEYGYPPSFVAEDNATLATALAQSAPTLHSIASKQGTIKAIYELVTRYVIDTWIHFNPVNRGKDRSFEVTMTPISADQSATQAGTLNATALALRGFDDTSIVDRGLIRDAMETALLQSGLVTQEQIEARRVRNDMGEEMAPPPRPDGRGAGPQVGPGAAGASMGMATRISKARVLKALEDPALARLLSL